LYICEIKNLAASNRQKECIETFHSYNSKLIAIISPINDIIIIIVIVIVIIIVNGKKCCHAMSDPRQRLYEGLLLLTNKLLLEKLKEKYKYSKKNTEDFL